MFYLAILHVFTKPQCDLILAFQTHCGLPVDMLGEPANVKQKAVIFIDPAEIFLYFISIKSFFKK